MLHDLELGAKVELDHAIQWQPGAVTLFSPASFCPGHSAEASKWDHSVKKPQFASGYAHACCSFVMQPLLQYNGMRIGRRSCKHACIAHCNRQGCSQHLNKAWLLSGGAWQCIAAWACMH
jgi:hypothetical protein